MIDLRVLSGERRGVMAALCRAALWPAGVAYSGIMRARNAAYDHAVQAVRLGVPCISVGNLTTGGTGKTPLVRWLAAALAERGRRVGLINRGYRAGPTGSDELNWLRAVCPQADVVSNPDRIAAGRSLCASGCDVVVLDDAFQHRRVARDLDIVLIDALNPDGYGHLLPRGLLREPLRGIRRADLIILTRVSLAGSAAVAELKQRWARWFGTTPVVGCDHRPARLVDARRVETDLAVLRDHVPLALAGIGNPAGFLGTLDRLGVRPAGFMEFVDHHPYTVHDAERVIDAARRGGATMVLTTEKDLVKLQCLPIDWPLPLRALQVTIDFVGEGGKMVLNLVDRCLAEFNAP